jgi:hypothetical protein
MREMQSDSIVYANGHGLLEWREPIRLSSDIPGSNGMRFLLPTPTAVFEESFATVQEDNGTTCLCLLPPMYEEEVDALSTGDPMIFMRRWSG